VKTRILSWRESAIFGRCRREIDRLSTDLRGALHWPRGGTARGVWRRAGGWGGVLSPGPRGPDRVPRCGVFPGWSRSQRRWPDRPRSRC